MAVRTRLSADTSSTFMNHAGRVRPWLLVRVNQDSGQAVRTLAETTHCQNDGATDIRGVVLGGSLGPIGCVRELTQFVSRWVFDDSFVFAIIRYIRKTV
jgi:hypothetical protein